ncbi:MAG: PSD1 and planctomycete cytochrome C domain-containing protein [Planctomycetia bacterium]|nr:PSD1 and planctomycete cytochrome C domain-containing protein [Planctomycetia bacterium]
MPLRSLESCARVGLLTIVALLAAASQTFAESPATPIDFSKQIRPLLSNHCYACHGPDEKNREAGLRLDQHASAFGKIESGETAIVAGHPEKSELFRRVTAKDDERMPPAKHAKALKPEEIDLLRKWIAGGADWKDHWAFAPPQRPELPPVANMAWCRNAIDRLVLARLEKEKLAPSPETDPRTLIRRVTLDLTGLPPTPEEVDAFLADKSPAAYEKVVDRLLASPRYGEHMARYWLDAARYGDTHGMHIDNIRSIYPYRDWVIGAFNKNKRFDEFTIEQLAGDLLPNATPDQRVATGFVRCHVSTGEGGSIAEEVQIRNTTDRVVTTSTVFLGLTAGCAVCHDHKFDPLTRKEFYSLSAFFNSTTEGPLDGNAADYGPVVRVTTPQQRKQVEAIEIQIAAVNARISEALAKITAPAATPAPTRNTDGTYEYVWLDDSLPTGAEMHEEGGAAWQFIDAPKDRVFSGTRSMIRTAKGKSQQFFTGADPGLVIGKGDRLFAYIYLDPKNPPQEVMLQWNNGPWDHRAFWGKDLVPFGAVGTPARVSAGPLPEVGRWVRLEVDAARVGFNPGDVVRGLAFTQFDGTVYWDRAGIVTSTPQADTATGTLAAWQKWQRGQNIASLPAEVRAALALDPQKQSAVEQRVLHDYYYRFVSPQTRGQFEPFKKQLTDLEAQRSTLEKSGQATLVMQELPKPREAFDLVRGQYDQHGDKVSRVVPAFLPPLPAHEGEANRLTLARWLVSPGHPLMSRVTVNRFWQQYFGTGIVKTSEDFGSQGDWPSNPQLLDFLATEFIRTGWDVKGLQKLIVMSATYRQSSRVTPQLLERDPENRLLARGPRFRLDGEAVRDVALAVSGLLVDKIGGPPARPYQPDGIWEAVAYTASNTAHYKRDTGEGLFRRSLYTFWKRTAPPPEMVTFDAPSREACACRRPRTNTPLQSLVLLNDVQFFEPARHLAERMITEGGTTDEGRAERGFLLATSRPLKPNELAVLLKVYRRQLEEFQKAPEAVNKLLANGESKVNPALDRAQLAAWTMVANLLLNLDETITKG